MDFGGMRAWICHSFSIWVNRCWFVPPRNSVDEALSLRWLALAARKCALTVVVAIHVCQIHNFNLSTKTLAMLSHGLVQGKMGFEGFYRGCGRAQSDCTCVRHTPAVSMCEAQVQFPAPRYLGVVEQAWSPSTRDVEAGASQVQGHLQLPRPKRLNYGPAREFRVKAFPMPV